MKKFKIQYLVVLFSLFVAPTLWALDPIAPIAERSGGLVYVTTPQPAMDVITLQGLGNQYASQIVQGGQAVRVPIGNYKVSVKMQDYTYTQDFAVHPTERADIVVPGYGSLKVNSPYANSGVEVYTPGMGRQVASFSSDMTKILPTGTYDVKIHVGKHTLTQNNVRIVTNTTRQLDIKL